MRVKISATIEGEEYSDEIEIEELDGLNFLEQDSLVMEHGEIIVREFMEESGTKLPFEAIEWFVIDAGENYTYDAEYEAALLAR